jgi:hypothetical protein
MRRADLRPREYLVHVRLQLAVPLGARQLADDVAREALDEVRLVRYAARAQRRALDAQALEQERAEIDLLEPAPAEEAGDDHAPVRRERGDVLVPVRRADKVDHDVRAVPARRALDLLGSVLRLVVHACRRALGEPGRDEVELVLARRGSGDGRRARRQSLRRRVKAGGTYAPRSRASWIAAIPTPDAAAWMRMYSPAFSSPSTISAWYTAYMRQTSRVAERKSDMHR